MKKKVKNLLLMFLAFTLVLNFNITVYAQESNIPSNMPSAKEAYLIEIGNNLFELQEGESIVVPLEKISSRSASSDTEIGLAGLLKVWGDGHYVNWAIIMSVPATAFIGTVSATDITSGLRAGSSSVTGFYGSVYVARISGHQYSAHLNGTAYYGIVPIARTKSNTIRWRP